jgi:peptide/nickel transport system permease protein
MLPYIARRLVAAVPIIVGITFFVFLIINLAPGDPVAMMINPNRPLSPVAMMARREALGLNKPLLVRYVLWLGEVVRGNLAIHW